MLPGTLVYNGLMLLLGAAGLALTRGTRSLARVLMAGALVGSGGVLLARLLSADPMLGENSMFGRFRLLAYLIFLHVPILLVTLGFLFRRDRRRWAVALFGGALAIWLVAVDAFLIEPRWLEVTDVELHSEKLDRKLTVAVLADLQTDEFGSYEKKVLKRVLVAAPDLILMPGDYLQPDPGGYPEISRQFSDYLREIDFGAPLGAFAVRGNVERDDWPALFAGTGVTALVDTEAIELKDGLWLTGLSLKDSFAPFIAVSRRKGYHIVLGHSPDFAAGKVEADLLVAGHTHGGQVRIPFLGPPVTLSMLPRQWTAGTTQLAPDRTLVVSRGVGMERGTAPRIRFLCRPELAILHLKPS